MRRRNLLVLLAGILLLTACSPIHHPPAGAAGQARQPAGDPLLAGAPMLQPPPQLPLPPPEAEEQIRISGAGFDLHTAGRVPQATFDAAWAGVLDTLNGYLRAAVLTPLRTGGPAEDLTPFFTSLSASQVMAVGEHRAAFIDEGLAPVASLRSDAAVARLTALAGADGTMSVVVADLDLRLRGLVEGAPLVLERSGELVLMPEGRTWRIDAWDLKVTRRLAQTSTTTRAQS